MSIYQPLADFLAAREDDRWEASFIDIMKVLNRSLPNSAYKHQAWWANQDGDDRSQARAWRAVGWRTTRLDLERRRVTFERDRATPSRPAELAALFEQAARLSGISDEEALTAEAMRALIAREAMAALAGLGGAMPDYQPSVRERP